jgi:hypothetical protein
VSRQSWIGKDKPSPVRLDREDKQKKSQVSATWQITTQSLTMRRESSFLKYARVSRMKS